MLPLQNECTGSVTRASAKCIPGVKEHNTQELIRYMSEVDGE